MAYWGGGWERALLSMRSLPSSASRSGPSPSVPVYERLWERSPQRLAIRSRHPRRTEPQCHLQRKVKLSLRENLLQACALEPAAGLCIYPGVAPPPPPHPSALQTTLSVPSEVSRLTFLHLITKQINFITTTHRTGCFVHPGNLQV